jgi:MATE family multidrug resistance protein
MDMPAQQQRPGTGAPEGSYRELLGLAMPNVASRLGVMAMGLTDAIVVGHYSAVQLGYHALGWGMTGTVLVAGIGLLLGVQVMTARFIGAGQPERTGAVLRRGLVYACWIGVASTAVLVLLGPPALRLLGLAPDMVAGATPVLLIFAASLLPYLLADAFWFWLEAVGKPQVPMAAMWGANAVNLALNLWLVPGTSPFPVAGAEAAAWTTLFARTALLLLLAGYVLAWPGARARGVFRPAPHEPGVAREQRRIGYATGVSYALEAGSFSGLNYVAAQLGVLMVAAWSVVLNVAAVMFMIPLGIAAATAVFVARAVGARSVPAMHRAFAMGLKLALGVLAALSLAVFLEPRLVVSAYTGDAELKALVVPALLLSCLFFMADGAQVVAAQALRARGDTWWPTGLHFISYMVVMLPLAWLLGVHRAGGLEGIVWAVIIGSFVSAAGLMLRFRALGTRMADAPA